MNTTPVAFFDFDGTLTTGDSLFPFIRHVVGTPRLLAGLVIIAPVLAGFGSGVVSRRTAKETVLRRYFCGRDIDELRGQGECFAVRVLPRMLRAEGMERLAWHRQQGHDCVLVSASLDIYLRAWARDAGLTDILTSSLQVDQHGRATGALEGPNCHGETKRERIQAWLTGRDPGRTYAYGNSSGDMAMLHFVDEGWLYMRGEYHRI